MTIAVMISTRALSTYVPPPPPLIFVPFFLTMRDL